MRRSRFSLYCLDDGDEYFGDVIADYFVPLKVYQASASARGNARATAARSDSSSPLHSVSVKIRGRLRLAGRALFFEPDDWSRPIRMFRFRDMANQADNQFVGLTTEEFATKLLSEPPTGVMKDMPVVYNSTSSSGFFAFVCENVVTQMPNGEVGPFGSDAAHGKKPHLFGFPFGTAATFVDRFVTLFSLHRSTRGGEDAAVAIANMIREKEKQTPFLLTSLVSAEENILKEFPCAKIWPLVAQRGRLVITTERIYFQPTFPVASQVEVMDLKRVRRVERRRIRFRETGIEFAAYQQTQLSHDSGSADDPSRTLGADVTLYDLFEQPRREDLYKALNAHPKLERVRVNSLDVMTMKWSHGFISTFDYLMYLNWAAGRSVNDLAQYPVLPWVLADYTSETLNLSDPKVFRDLTKPIGALNPTRLQRFQQRANDLRSIGEEAYLYGSHYSNPAYVTFFTVRERPELMLVLHSGKLDHGSRMFDSIAETFSGVLSGPTDLKELIPEFYFGTGEFLKEHRMPLGCKSDASVRVSPHVILPPWASSAENFIELNRAALEGEVVSKSICHWIDLVFGCKQDGEAAWSANNVFHPYSYESCVQSLEGMKDAMKRTAMETHIREFGQMPKKLFHSPHPPRKATKTRPEAISLLEYIPPDSDALDASSMAVSTPAVTQQVSLSAAPPDRVVEGPGANLSPTAARESPAPSRSSHGVFEGEEDDSDEEDRRRSPTSQPLKGSAAKGEAHYDPLGLLPSAMASATTVADVQRLVDEALDLTHVLLEKAAAVAQEEPTDLSASPPPPLGGGAASLSSNREITYRQTITRCGIKGKIESSAVCLVPSNSDWLFDDYSSPTVPLVFIGDSSGGVHIVDLVHGKRIRTINDSGNQASVTALCHIVSSELMAIGSASGAVSVFHLGSGSVVTSCEEISSSVSCLSSWSNGQDSCYLAVGGKDGRATVWKVDLESKSAVIDPDDVCTEIDGTSRTSAVAVSGDLRVSSSSSRQVALLAATGSELFLSGVQSDEIEDLNLSLVAPGSSGSPGRINTNAATALYCGFAELHGDSLFVVVTEGYLMLFDLQGEAWGEPISTPFPVAFAAALPQSFTKRHELLLGSAKGELATVAVTSSGVVTGAMKESAAWRGEWGPSSVAVSVSIAGTASEDNSLLIALGDAAGKVHVLSLASSN